LQSLNKPPYAPRKHPYEAPHMHHDATLCGWLIPSVQRVSEKNSSRQLDE
jgi:hypothetical protein